MIPIKHDITIWRGTSFEEEFISQIKTYNYDPLTNNSKADLVRTHAENLKYYGFEYSYLNFAVTYERAELIFNKAWLKAAQSPTAPLLILTAAADKIILGPKNIKILMTPDDTRGIEFDAAVYELMLYTADGSVDKLLYGDVIISGNK